MAAAYPIELLAPAGNLNSGLAAVNHGADAVYIAGPQFGARAAAGCSLDDIEKLINYAHQFRVKVYIALNTILTDDELPQAVHLAHQLHDLSADALIIQDVGLLESDLPPIPLHSSTQMNNREVAKVQFLEKVGFQQIVLARELSLEKISAIRAATAIPLEFFVHGALCVSYSGQCYISEVMADRSANRGRCAQFCRHKFTLKDLDGKQVEKDKYLLSLKDLDLSASLQELIDAGVSSFKIEGRLKDENYVKNVTAYYRQILDKIIADSSGRLRRSSAGTTKFDFSPDPKRSFHRGGTEYYLKRAKARPAEIRSSKSTGKPLGRVEHCEKRWFSLVTEEKINNGDGLCYFDESKGLVGIRVNRVDGQKIYPKDEIALEQGELIYRNSDLAFIDQVQKSHLCRTLKVQMRLTESSGGLVLACRDEDGIETKTFGNIEKEPAKNLGAATTLADKQLRKCGGTLFTVEDIEVEIEPGNYYPAAGFNGLRRDALDNHMAERLRRYQPERVTIAPNTVPWPYNSSLSYLDNVANRAAEKFYRRHGVEKIDQSRLRAAENEACALMTTKYCIRFQLGICPNQKDEKISASPLILADNAGKYRITFNCPECEMVLRLEK